MKFSELSKELLRKARESAILAVEIYNKPAIQFRSGGYIVLMVIAWTALFHAIFYKRKVKPYYKSKGKFVYLPSGDVKLWELDQCARQYFKSDTNNPIEKNLSFFIPLRNEFEHRSYPAIDANIFGECQSMLLNFDEIIGNEFGDSYRIRECLTFSLQLFPSGESLSQAVLHNANTKRIVDFITNYRSSISSEVVNSGKYSFKAFLIQVSNHQSKDSLPIQFVNFDKLEEEDKNEIERIVRLTKEKIIEVPVLNADFLRAGDVSKQVQERMNNPIKKYIPDGKFHKAFNNNINTICCKVYGIKPDKGSTNPQITESKYCVYDKLYKNYVYKQEWVEFLVSKLSDNDEFERILNYAASEKRWELVVQKEK